MELFVVDDKIAISTKHFIISAFNILYALVSIYFIKKYKLIAFAGLGKQKFKNWFLLIFPFYIIILNWPEPGDIDYASISTINYIAVLIWSLSVGFSEELMLRGFIQSLFLKKFATTKKRLVLSVLGAAFIFGILHLVKFDKGIYGEITQVIYATFIATMFGALLLRTHKIWPLIIVHALIDFVGNLEKFQATETTIKLISKEPQTLEDSIVIVLVVLPCFIYGLLLLRKVKIDDIQKKMN
jgi:membrane protease YdiL (CAAX protease family)